MRSLGFIPWFLLFATHVSGQPPEATVTLKSNRSRRLAEQPASTVLKKALDLLKTSNFNSQDHADTAFPGGTRRVHQRYRDTVAGQYLVIGFSKPRDFQLIRGHAAAIEIVVGLNHPRHADAMFTIHPDGRVVEHAKYSGELATDLLDLVRESGHGFQQDLTRPGGREYFERDGILYDSEGNEVGRWGVDGQRNIVPGQKSIVPRR